MALAKAGHPLARRGVVPCICVSPAHGFFGLQGRSAHGPVVAAFIWEYTAERVFDHPWLGVGANSTRVLKEPNTREMAEWPPGFAYPRTIGWHAHDLFLQTWFELGVIGALLIAFAGAMVALRMSLLPVEVQPFAAASLTAFMAIVSFGWGMWQEWLICGAALLLVFLLVGASLAERE